VLSPADAALVRRDTGLPGLATLLDTEAFAEVLRARLPGSRIQDVRAVYIRYKPATNCLVSYRVETDRGPLQLHAKAHGGDAAVKLGKALARARSPDVEARRWLVPEAGIVVSLFPHDSKLEVLERLADPDACRGMLSKVLSDRPDLWGGRIEPLRYKPERRFVARLVAEGSLGAALKFYTPDDFNAANKNSKRLHSRQRLWLADRIGAWKRKHVMALEWIPGRPLQESLAAATPGFEAFAVVGAALAELHVQRDRKLRDRTLQGDVSGLRALACTVGFLYPALASRAEAVAEKVAGALADVDAEPCTIHGDFYDRQVLVADDRVVVLDLDRAMRGVALADLGLFVAHLERDSLLGRYDRGRVCGAGEALVEGYQRAASRPLPEGLGAYIALGLFQLATEPFRRHLPDWPAHTEALLERAEAAAAGRSKPGPA
jgi:hypothetical protein